jgi:hypothetical protein
MRDEYAHPLLEQWKDGSKHELWLAISKGGSFYWTVTASSDVENAGFFELCL